MAIYTPAAARRFALNDLRQARKDQSRLAPQIQAAEVDEEKLLIRIAEEEKRLVRLRERLEKRRQCLSNLREKFGAAVAREQRVVSAAAKLCLSARDLDQGAQPQG